MANIDSASSARSRRRTNHELPLVPFIDFLLCLVTFLLATASFADFARVSAEARVPANPDSPEPPDGPPKQLHLDMQEHVAHVSWRQNGVVLETHDVPLTAVDDGSNSRRYPALAEFLTQDYERHATHRTASDPIPDQAVLHVRNSAPYEDVVAALDALNAPRRSFPGARQTAAFSVSFAAN